MSRVNRDLVSRVRFEADSRMASASMDALGSHATELQRKIGEVNDKIKALGDVKPDDAAFIALDRQLKGLNSDLKDVNATMKDYTRGVKAAGELFRYYQNGNLEDMSVKAIRAGVNGMKKRYDNLKAGGDPADAEQMRLIETIMNEADVVLKRFKTDYENVVQLINSGATVTEQTLRRTRDGLADLMQTAEGSDEKQVLQNYWSQVNTALEQTIVENRRLKGEIADRTDAMRIANATDHEGAQQAIADAQARAEAARKENEEISKRLAANRQLRDNLQTEMDVNSIQQQNLMRQKQELKQQEKEERTARQQRVDDARKEQTAARRAAKEQQTAYDDQKKTVESLRTEVQGLTADIEKMGQQQSSAPTEKQTEALKKQENEVARLTQAYEKAVDKMAGLEDAWDNKIKDYIAEKYPTQAVLSAKSKSPEGLKEREAMKKDNVLAKMQEQMRQEVGDADEKMMEVLGKLSIAEEKLREARERSSQAQQQSTQSTQAETESDGKLAEMKDKLAQKSGELTQQEAKLNEQDAKELSLSEMKPKVNYKPSDDIAGAVRSATLAWTTEAETKENTVDDDDNQTSDLTDTNQQPSQASGPVLTIQKQGAGQAAVTDQTGQPVSSGTALTAGQTLTLTVTPVAGKTPTATLGTTALTLTEDEGQYTVTFQMPSESATLTVVTSPGDNEGD